MPLADVVVNSLTEIVGEAGVITRPEDVIPYGFDGTAVLKQRPEAVVFPRTVEQVADCVALASTNAVPISGLDWRKSDGCGSRLGTTVMR